MKKAKLLILTILILTVVLILPLTACKKKKGDPDSVTPEVAYEFVEGSTVYIKIGKYPQKLETEVSVEDIKASGTYSESTGYYTYNDKEYKIIAANPCTQDMTPTFSNGEVAVAGKEYAFIVEPIVWKIINKALKEDFYLAYSDYILDTSIYQYQSKIGKTTINPIIYYLKDDEGNLRKDEEIYANNWENSVLRQNLHNFYNVAFSDVNKSAIQTYTMKNGSPNGGSNNYFPYHQKDTEEQVFVLSSEEAQKSRYGYTTEDKDRRLRKVTDFAIAKGVFCLATKGADYYGWAWTRTAGTASNNVHIIDTQGNLDVTYISDDSNLKVGYAPAVRLNII